MPIPTRSMSLREPRQQPGSNIAPRAAPKPTPTAADNTLNRRKSTLLRGNREDAATAMKGQTQSQETRLPRGNPGTATSTATSPATHRRGTSQQFQRQQQEGEKRPRSQGSATATATTPSSSGGTVARRQSLVRPSPLKTSTTTGTGTGTGIATPAGRNPATSPRKREIPRPQTSPRKINNDKTDMPPPPLPRHVRSSSLKQQPSSTSLSSPGGSASPGRQDARHRSQIVTTGDSKAPTAVKKGESEGIPRAKPLLKPYQQVSPKKTAGTRLTGVSAVGSGVGTAAEPDPSLMPSSWPEIAALQTDVLHLHLYHSSSLQQHAEWQTESETQLRNKYNSVAQTYRAIVNDEKQRQRCLNGQALSTWLRNVEPTAASTSDQVQHLSQIIQEITDLTDPLTGRYTLALQTFDTWFHKANEIRKCRRQLDSDAATGLLVFIDPLDDHDWREEVNTLSLKLEFCERQLQSLDILGHFGDVGGQEDSALVRVVRGLEELLLGLSKEVAVVKRIERDIVRTERVWVTSITEQFCGDGARSGPSRPREERLGLWRSAVQS